jgi:type VI protein secretion system component Hcp
MKQLYLSIALALSFGAASAQLTIYMKVAGITTGNGDKITAYQDNVVSGTPALPKAAFDPIKITKAPGTTMRLLSDLWKGTHIATAEFDFYDNTNTLVYSVQLTELAVTKFSNLSPACPSCGSLTDEIWLTFSTIQYMDAANNIIFGWDVNKNTSL